MIEDVVPPDQQHGDFFQQFLEQRIRKMNNPTDPTTTDSIFFPQDE